jgi:hypothetical protein
MTLFDQKLWVIVTKDRKMIAKGVPRSRYLIPIDDESDKKRILTYTSKNKAIAGYKGLGFYGMKGYTEGDLEAIPVQMFMVVLIEEDGSGD